MTSVNPPTTLTNILVNTRTSSKIVFLPTVSTVGAGKLYFIKDICGNAANSSIFLSTTGLDVLENSTRGSTLYGLMSTNFQSVLLASDGLLNWMVLQNYNTNVVSRAGFTPLSISGIQLWLDGSDSSSTSMTLSGTTITQWRDKSGNGNHTTGGSGTVSLVSNAVNGRSVASFTNTYFTGPVATFTGTQLQCFAVAMMNSASTAYGRIFSLSRPGVHDFNETTTTFPFIRNNGGTQIMIGRNGSYLAVNTPGYLTTFLVQSGHNGSTEFIGVNGTLTPSSQNTGVSTAFNINAYGVGTNVNTGDTGGYWHGYIAEVIYYTGLFTTLQRQQVEGYLAWKWGLQANLPAGHPYQTSPP